MLLQQTEMINTVYGRWQEEVETTILTGNYRGMSANNNEKWNFIIDKNNKKVIKHSNMIRKNN